MGVFKMFSSSSASPVSTSIGGISSSRGCRSYTISSESKNLPNPDPSNYTIKRYVEDFGGLVIEINYTDCNNYEGNKILVYRNINALVLEKQGLIDPHFCENPDFISPFARFEPTEDGWKEALKLITK
jgi:hypothetical protein